MEKKISDEELDRLLEEQFLNEADAIEDAIFSDDFEEYEEETEEEVDAAYEELVSRLKERENIGKRTKRLFLFRIGENARKNHQRKNTEM